MNVKGESMSVRNVGRMLRVMVLLLICGMFSGCAGQNNRTWEIVAHEGALVGIYINGLQVEKVGNEESGVGPDIKPDITIPVIPGVGL